MTKDGNFQCEGSSILQREYRDNPADGCFQEGIRSLLNTEW